MLGLGEAQVRARTEVTVAAADADRFERLLTRRLRGEPVAYLLGEREFYGRPFAVDRRVLVPRPETEHLVEAALGLELPAAPRLLDIGTGSGCIAITFALERPAARVIATDLSPAALAVAGANAVRHSVTPRLALLAADLAAPLHLATFDLVVSNPPYIAPEVMATLSLEITGYEPSQALFAPQHGRAVLVRLLAAAAALRPGAWLLLEIGHDQAPWLRAALPPHLALEALIDDYAGIPRTAVLHRRGVAKRKDGSRAGT